MATSITDEEWDELSPENLRDNTKRNCDGRMIPQMLEAPVLGWFLSAR